MNNLRLQMVLNEILQELKKLNASSVKKVKRNQPVRPEMSAFNLEEIYRFYPRKEGKTGGMRILARSIKNRDDYNNLRKAVDNYRDLCRREKTERKFIKLFSTFAACWTDYLQPHDPEAALKTRIEEPTSFII